MSEKKEHIKCDHCEEEAVMYIKNLKNGKETRLCKRHFGAFVTQGQSEIMMQFAEATGGQFVPM